jgi:hypothetical protein
MSFRNWIWVYLTAGESFTRWAVLLFYGTVCGIVLCVLGLVITLATVMAARI